MEKVHWTVKNLHRKALFATDSSWNCNASLWLTMWACLVVSHFWYDVSGINCVLSKSLILANVHALINCIHSCSMGINARITKVNFMSPYGY